jgi:hypothetical protein
MACVDTGAVIVDEVPIQEPSSEISANADSPLTGAPEQSALELG